MVSVVMKYCIHIYMSFINVDLAHWGNWLLLLKAR